MLIYVKGKGKEILGQA